MTDDGDAAYRPFPSFGQWRGCAVDLPSVADFASLLAAAL